MVFDEANFNETAPPCLCSSVLGEQGLFAVLDDGSSGHDADEGVLVIHHGNKILGGGPVDEIVHGGGDPDGYIVLSAGNLCDLMGFGLTHIHITDIAQGPKQVPLRKGARYSPCRLRMGMDE